jgi:hypothetical protein
MGAANVTVLFEPMSPVLNFLSLAVTVWSTESLFITVTFSPGLTVIVDGEKEKFWIVMAADPLGVVEPLPDPDPLGAVVVAGLEVDGPALQAVPTTARPMSATAMAAVLCAWANLPSDRGGRMLGEELARV